jgi:5'-phosphate synthase pdxT subunit
LVKVGVLALQGAFAKHVAALSTLGCAATEVRTESELAAVDALVMPGGESTTVSKLLDSNGLYEPMAERIERGMPIFGTCAGMILLAAHVLDGRADQRSFAAIDIDVRRNAYGRQVDSFETDLVVDGLDHPFHAVFIRAPRVERVGASVDVLARSGDDPVLCRSGQVWVAAFHPELTEDLRIHQRFIEEL